MFKIGEFAKIAGVSTHVLRNYDKSGLLHPLHTDPTTGYRYYSIQQLSRLNRVIALKDLGLTLEQIGRLVEDQITPNEIQGMLKLKEAQLEQEIEAERARLARVRARLRQLHHEGDMPTDEVIVKSLDAQPYLSIGQVRLTDADIATLFGRFLDMVDEQEVACDGLGQAVIHGAPDRYNRHHIEIGVALVEPQPVSFEVPPCYTSAVRELETIPTMATLMFVGPRCDTHRGYNAIYTWMEFNGFTIADYLREIYWQPGATDSDPNNVVELQVPITLAN